MNLLRRSVARSSPLRLLPHTHAMSSCACPPPPEDTTTTTTTTDPSSTTTEDMKYVDEKDLKHLLANNQTWVAEQTKKDPLFFDKLGAGQAPEYLYIGCSDSRVPANEILGLSAGGVFVHRNVGNLVVGTDLNVLSVLEYAVDHLDVKHVIVTGHYDCGAVKASVEPQDLGLVENWIRNIRDVYRLHFTELDAIQNKEEKHRRLVELNVVEQCLNVYKTGVVQRKRLKTFAKDGRAYPRIHALVFDPKDGILNRLPVHFREEMSGMEHVYNLYDKDEAMKDQELKDLEEQVEALKKK